MTQSLNYQRVYRLSRRKSDPEYAERLRAHERKDYAKHRERRLAYVKQQNKELREWVLHFYGAVCVCCAESQLEFLTIDHINNDGAADRKQNGSNRCDNKAIFRQLKKSGIKRDDLQVLCYNCNCAKQFSGTGKCPHQK